MRKDSECLLRKAVEYSKKVEKESFELDFQYFEEISNIESAIYEIIDDLIYNDCITRNSGVIDAAKNVKIELTMDGLNYFKNLTINEKNQEDLDRNNEEFGNNIHNNIMNKFIKKRYRDIKINPVIIESYSRLFKSFVCVKKDDSELQQVDNLFQFAADKVNETNNENYIKVVGPDGTGKSTFLSLLYLYLYENFCSRKIKHYPFYINLHYYDSNTIDAENMDELNKVIKEEINKDINTLVELSKMHPNMNFLIIIDGNEKYERTHLKSGIYLENLLKKITNHKKIICLGEKTNIHLYRDRNENIGNIDNLTTYTFYFSSIYINQKDRWEDEIKQFCQIFGSEKQVSNINKCIEQFSVKEIDYNLLTIFCEVSKKTNLLNVSSISDLYYQYCLEHLEKNENKLRISTELSYKYFMTKEFIEQKYISQNWREWELVHQHKTVSNYLLALHYSGIIFDGDAENVKQFECAFTNGINTFLKAIINRSKSNQRDTIKFCRKMFKEDDFRIKAQAAYLVGRVKDVQLQEEAKELLNNQLKIWSVKNIPNDNKRREQFFVKRSILVSLLYLGDCSAGEILIRDFFEFPVMNEVNRAFYLQYYEDVIKEPEVVNLKDSGQEKITYTVGVLFNVIHAELLKDELEWSAKSRYIFQVYLFTLCSLIQQRLNTKQNILCDEEELNLVLEKSIKALGNDLEEDIRIYITMLQEDILNSSYNIGHLYDELYMLKDIQRRGWVEKIVTGSIEVDRYENVVEHTYYAWLLGMLYLPENRPTGQDYIRYDKKKVLNCLLIHDLAERYVGDKLPEESNDKHRQDEDECIKRIFRHDMYVGIGNMNAYRKVWRNFGLESKDINGRIAKEIDIMQAIYQFCVYKKAGARFAKEKETEWKNERYKIKTSLGKRIFNEVVLKKFKGILEQ